VSGNWARTSVNQVALRRHWLLSQRRSRKLRSRAQRLDQGEPVKARERQPPPIVGQR